MICPVCSTNNTNNQSAESCVQCGSDFRIHQLLCKVREEIQVSNESTKVELLSEKKTSKFSVFFQTMPSILLLLCSVFIIFVGMRFLSFLEHTETQRSSIANKWSETGFEQLQQMNSVIKQELDLIIEQRRDNQVLQSKIQDLSGQVLKNKTVPMNNSQRVQ